MNGDKKIIDETDKFQKEYNLRQRNNQINCLSDVSNKQENKNR